MLRRSTYLFPDFNVYTADMLPYAVTFDLCLFDLDRL